MTQPFRFAVQGGPFDDPVALGEHARRGYAHECLIGDDDQVRSLNNAALLNRLSIRPHIGEDGGAPTLGAVTWGVLHLVSGQEEGAAQNPAGGQNQKIPQRLPAMALRTRASANSTAA